MHAVTYGGTWQSGNYGSYAGDSCCWDEGGCLASSGGSHTVTSCNRRVLARCP